MRKYSLSVLPMHLHHKIQLNPFGLLTLLENLTGGIGGLPRNHYLEPPPFLFPDVIMTYNTLTTWQFQVSGPGGGGGGTIAP